MANAQLPQMLAAPIFFIKTILLRDWQFLGVTMVSCAVAAIVATFQYSVYTSFVLAGSVVPRVLDGDIWVTASTVECFDFPDPINEDYAGLLARYGYGASFRRVVFGFATWRSPTGRRGNVAIVGIDGSNLPDNGFLVDRSDLKRLDLELQGGDMARTASISDTTLVLARVVDTLPTFLGAPYVIVPFERGRELLGMEAGKTSFLVGSYDQHTAPFADSDKVARRFPEIAMVSGRSFEASSSRYWQKKTGAGLAVLLAAVLAGLLMAILLTSGVLRFIQRYHNDLISLLGHGADTRDIGWIIGGIATLIAGTTIVAALTVTPVIIGLFSAVLPWAQFRLLDSLVPVAGILASLAIAMLASRRAIAAFGPEAVFRS